MNHYLNNQMKKIPAQFACAYRFAQILENSEHVRE